MHGNPYYEGYWVDSNDDLEHYGVLGMKWGIRKDANKAYSKAGAKLEKLNKKVVKLSNKAAKKEQKALKKQRKASSAILFQKTKAKRASKATRKALKVYQKAQEKEVKAYRWNESMKKVFSGITVSNADQKYIELRQKYANRTIDDIMRNNVSVNSMMNIDDYYRKRY